MTKQAQNLRTSLVNIEEYHNKILDISRALLSLQSHSTKSEYNNFYDKELDERVNHLITFFGRKYSDLSVCKTVTSSISERPIFHRKGVS